MTLAEIGEQMFKFHRAVYISLTQQCPIRCSHCFVESGPQRKERVDYPQYCEWIKSLIESPFTKTVFFSGGEPYSHPRALRFGLSACGERDLYSIICTSAFWAKNRAAADRILDGYPLPRCVWISTDAYHEEFVPLKQVRIAAEAAKARGLDVVVQLTDTGETFQDFMGRYEEDVGFDVVPQNQIYVAQFSHIGRALTDLAKTAGTESASGAAIRMPCAWLSAPWLHEDGKLCACPNLEVFKTEGHPLVLADLHAGSYAASSAAADQDLYVQALRVFGPVGLSQEFPVEAWGWEKPDSMSAGPCDVCHSLARVPGLPNKVRERAGAPQMRARIAALRLALYGEMPNLTEKPPRTSPSAARGA